MNFDFSPDQQELRAEVRRFLEARCPANVVRGVLDDPLRSHDADLWASLVEQGWTAFTLPESHGGLGMSRIDLCVLAEELGRVLAPVPFASTIYILAEALMMAGNDEQRALLDRIADGSCIGCLAAAEGPGESAANQITASVTNGRLTGVKMPVTDGMAATHALVSVREGDGAKLFLVDLSQTGVEREALSSLDPARDVARISFDAVPCEPIGDERLLSRILDGAAVFLAFEQIGGADRCLEQTVEYAKVRYAFGRQIGSQQAVKHKLADMYVKNQIARSNAYYGAWALESDAEELPEAAAAARIASCDAYWYAAREGIHLHGGIGFTWEADMHMFYRRALQTGMLLGSDAHWRERLVGALEAQLMEAH